MLELCAVQWRQHIQEGGHQGDRKLSRQSHLQSQQTGTRRLMPTQLRLSYISATQAQGMALPTSGLDFSHIGYCNEDTPPRTFPKTSLNYRIPGGDPPQAKLDGEELRELTIADGGTELVLRILGLLSLLSCTGLVRGSRYVTAHASHK